MQVTIEIPDDLWTKFEERCKKLKANQADVISMFLRGSIEQFLKVTEDEKALKEFMKVARKFRI